MKDWTDVTRQDAVLRGSEKFHYKPTAGKSSPNNKHAGDFGISDPRKRWIQQIDNALKQFVDNPATVLSPEQLRHVINEGKLGGGD
ncbi:hypothetical protein [Mycobacterium simiae]|uniref:hypothetical protein n=1 Tax=Mycobacterium simiae TaxID=1784 RepID=UPI002621206D|nr:hypothetical protein [Mycobacterium simiae]